MNKAVIVYYGELLGRYQSILKMLQEIYAENGIDTELLGIDEEHQGHYYHNLLKAYDDAYLCSLDMAGFQFGTLLGDSLYNILRSMQLHLVLEPEILKDYEGIEPALNAFLFVPEEKTEEWRKRNFRILNLSTYPPLKMDGDVYPDNEHNRSILKRMVQMVINERG